jgi:archaellum component FlaC
MRHYSIEAVVNSLRVYDNEIGSSLIGSESRINELENRIAVMEKLIESIADIDWNTVRYIDRDETS